MRYYLRGLGIGILVTAVIMTLSSPSSDASQMSDDEVRVRAAQLGMVDEDELLRQGAENLALYGNLAGNETADDGLAANTTVSDNEKESRTTTGSENSSAAGKDSTPVSENSSGSVSSAKAGVFSGSVSSAGAGNTTGGSSTAQAGSSSSSVNTENKTEEGSGTGTVRKVVVTINKGDGSLTAAKRAKDVGLVDDAEAFDMYLYSIGADKKLVVGDHAIEEGASMEEIARALTTAAY